MEIEVSDEFGTHRVDVPAWSVIRATDGSYAAVNYQPASRVYYQALTRADALRWILEAETKREHRIWWTKYLATVAALVVLIVMVAR